MKSSSSSSTTPRAKRGVVPLRSSQRLCDAARDEVVDHHAEIAVGAGDDERVACAGSRARGVDAGEHPLPRGFLVAGRAVDLSGKEQARHGLHFETSRQLARIDIVVFDGVAGPLHLRLLQPGNGRKERKLHVLGQRGGDTIGINGVVVETFRLEEDLMALALLEAHHLVFDRRAIARADAPDVAGVHRRAGEVRGDDGVGRFGGVGDVADDLRRRDALGQEGERLRRVVALLHLEAVPGDGLAVEARRRSGLQPAHPEPEPVEPI